MNSHPDDSGPAIIDAIDELERQMQKSVQGAMKRMNETEDRTEIVCSVFQFGMTSFLQLEWLLDAIEHIKPRETWL